MVLAILYLQIGHVFNRPFPDTPDNHWAFEILDRAKDIAEYPGYGIHRIMRGNYPMSRNMMATAWFDAYTAVSRQHLKCFENRRFDHTVSWDTGREKERKLTYSFANRLQYEFESIYDGLFKIQKEFDMEIYRMTTPSNRATINKAKLRLEIYQVERNFPALKLMLNQTMPDLRNVAYEDEK